MIKLQQILCPTDFSEFSLCALPYAVDLARQFEARLHCLHVVDESYQYALGIGESAMPMVVPMEEILQSAQQQITKFVEEHLQEDQARLQAKVMAGRPFVEIIRYARDNEIDLIVIATHGRGGLASMFLGSVAEKVVRKSPCPVMTIRHPGHEFQMP